MRISFRLKTVLGIALIEALFLSLLIVNSIRILSTSHESELTYRAQTLANVFSHAVSDAVLSMDLATLNALVTDLLSSEEVIKVEISNAQLVLISRPANMTDEEKLNLVSAYNDIVINGTVFGSVRIWLDATYVKEVVSDATKQSIQIALVEIIFVGLASIALGIYLTNHLLQLSNAIHDLRVGNFEGKEDLKRIPNDELGEAFHAFLELRTALQQSSKENFKMLARLTQLAEDNSRKETWLKAITNQLVDGFIAFDSQGTIHYANQPAIAMFGYHDVPMVGLTVMDMPFSEVQKQRLSDVVKRSAEFADPENLNRHRDEVILRRDGTPFAASMSISSIKSEGNDYYILTLSETAVRQKVEKQMIVSDAIRTGILESSISAVIAINEKGEVLEFNSSAEKLFGYQRQDVLNQEISNLIMPLRFRDGHRKGMKHFLETGQGPVLRKRIEIIASDSDSREFPVELAITPVQTAEGYVFTAVIDDISERIESTKRLEMAKDAADQANKEKSRFLASMSHEIRTPLNIILGMVDLLQGTKLNKQQKNFTVSAENAGRNLLDMINDVLDLSKIEAGKMEPNLGYFDPIQLFEDTVLLFKQRCHSKGLRLYAIVGSEIPKTIYSDALFFRQILSNLLSNAVNYTDTGYIVAKLHLTRLNGLLHLFVDVQDSGPGLSNEAQKELFQEYTQVKQSTPKLVKGTGLGLVICRELANQVGGDVSLQSELGQGSTFSFQLPLPSEPTTAKRTPLSGVHVHLLSQDPNWKSQMEHQLLIWGAMVNESINTADADKNIVLIDGDTMAAHPISDGAFDPDIKYLTLLENHLTRQSDYQAFSTVLMAPITPSRLLYVTELKLFSDADNGLFGEQDKQNQVESSMSLKELSGARVLLVEDSEANRVIVSTYLSEAGVDVTEVVNGEEAVAILRTKQFDAILMDMRMPVMGGIEATKRIREYRLADGIPIIALTAHAIKEAQDECLAIGMQDFLTKPIDRQRLLNTIAHWLDPDTAARMEVELPSSQTTAVELFDQTVIEQLIRDTNKAAVSNMLNVFFKECDRRIQLITEACEQNSLEHLEISVHALKSSAQTFGAFLLSEHAREMERLCREQQNDIAWSMKEPLFELVAQTRAEISEQLSSWWSFESMSEA